MNSICIATYNGEKYIEQQLKSILCQINNDDEVIISDDNSTDGTLAVIGAIGDPRVRVVKGGFRNFSRNFENALREAQGDVVFLFDQDDVWMPDKYRDTLKALENSVLVCTDATLVDQNLQPLGTTLFQTQKSGPGLIRNTLKCTYCGACMAFRKSVLTCALPFPSKMHFGHDLWIGVMAESIGKVTFVEKPYILYRRHADTHTSLSQNILTRSKRPVTIKILSRLQLIYYWSKKRIAKLIK